MSSLLEIRPYQGTRHNGIMNNSINQSNNPPSSDFKSHKILDFLNTIYIAFLLCNILYCAVVEEWAKCYSSILLLICFFIARILLQYKKAFIATNIISIGFYAIALIHTLFLKDVTTSYFILLLVPCLLAVIMIHRPAKFFYFGMSISLYFFCNWYVGLPLFSYYYFLFGLIPSFFALMYFHENLIQLNSKQKSLILKLEESNQEQQFFSQMMSHDLMAPINSIVGYSSLLKKDNAIEDDKKLTYVKQISESADNLRDLTTDLLVLSRLRIEEFDMDLVSIEYIVESVKKSLAFEIEQKNVEIEMVNMDTSIYSSSAGLKIVIQNLIANAIKYQPLDQSNHIPKIKLALCTETENNVICISDNGIGINQSHHEDLFTPFKRFHSDSAYKGSGLGLAICKKVMLKLNGDIRLENNPEVSGSTFKIILPKFPNQ